MVALKTLILTLRTHLNKNRCTEDNGNVFHIIHCSITVKTAIQIPNMMHTIHQTYLTQL